MGSDPSGLLTVVIPGTNYNPREWSNFGSRSNFIYSVGETFNDSENTRVINDKSIWSGADNDKARQLAAKSISDMISAYEFSNSEPLNIVGHSHGGNIGVIVSKLIDRRIDNLVTLGTPVRLEYSPNYSMIENHINVYSAHDPVQFLGGGQNSVSATVGYLFGGMPGYLMGKMLNWGEFGIAGRTYSGANNVNVTQQANDPRFAHGRYLNSDIWSIVDNIINK